MSSGAPKIIRFGPAEDSVWEAIAGQCDYATYYHTRPFLQVQAQNRHSAVPGKTATVRAWHVRFADGAEAVFPALHYRWAHGARDVAYSSAACCYGGWIGTGRFGLEHEQAAWRTLPWKNLCVRKNPHSPHAAWLRPVDRSYAEAAVVIDLRGGFAELEQTWRKRRSSIPRNAKSAYRSGIQVIRTEDEAGFRAFFEIYTINAARWDRPRLNTLEVMLALRRASPQAVHLWLAVRDGRPLSGVLIFLHRHHIAHFNRGTLPEGYELNAPSAVDVFVLQHYAEQGYWWYDLETSGGAPGPQQHKLRLGGVELPAPFEINYSPLQSAARGLFGTLRRLLRPTRATAGPAKSHG
jgi:hypothetical protein